jgi:hypothetical protein
MRPVDRDLIRGGHYGQRSSEPHSKAEHMAAPTNAARVKILLATSEPSTHGPFRPGCIQQFGRDRSESGHRADIVEWSKMDPIRTWRPRRDGYNVGARIGSLLALP